MRVFDKKYTKSEKNVGILLKERRAERAKEIEKKQREKCELLYNQLIEEGLMQVIRRFDDVIICNMANGFYSAFNYTVIDDIPMGVLIEMDELELALTDEYGFVCVLEQYRPEEVHKRLILYSEAAIETLRNIKKRTDAEGAELDLLYEKQLLKKILASEGEEKRQTIVDEKSGLSDKNPPKDVQRRELFMKIYNIGTLLVWILLSLVFLFWLVFNKSLVSTHLCTFLVLICLANLAIAVWAFMKFIESR